MQNTFLHSRAITLSDVRNGVIFVEISLADTRSDSAIMLSAAGVIGPLTELVITDSLGDWMTGIRVDALARV